MGSVLWIVLAVGIGFVAGAVSAFILGKRFVRRESEKLYARWLRREHHRRDAWRSRYFHDLRNPLFLIQAFTWTQLDKLKKGKGSDASEKVFETLHQHATKAISVLKEASVSDRKNNHGSRTVPQ